MALEQSCSFGPRLLENGGENIAGLHFGFLRALHVTNTRRQPELEYGGLLRFPFLSTLQMLDALFEMLVQFLPKARQVDARPSEDAFAFVVVRERVEQMLDGQIRVPPRHGLAICNGQNDFQGSRK